MLLPKLHRSLWLWWILGRLLLIKVLSLWVCWGLTGNFWFILICRCWRYTVTEGHCKEKDNRRGCRRNKIANRYDNRLGITFKCWFCDWSCSCTFPCRGKHSVVLLIVELGNPESQIWYFLKACNNLSQWCCISYEYLFYLNHKDRRSGKGCWRSCSIYSFHEPSPSRERSWDYNGTTNLKKHLRACPRVHESYGKDIKHQQRFTRVSSKQNSGTQVHRLCWRCGTNVILDAVHKRSHYLFRNWHRN